MEPVIPLFWTSGDVCIFQTKLEWIPAFFWTLYFYTTRMHSSRMHTICCSGRFEGGGVCLARGGVCLGEHGVSACRRVSAQGRLPPVDRQTDTCEKITFPQILLWTVNIQALMGLKPGIECGQCMRSNRLSHSGRFSLHSDFIFTLSNVNMALKSCCETVIRQRKLLKEIRADNWKHNWVKQMWQEN